MSKILHNFKTCVSQLLKRRIVNTNVLTKFWYGPNNTFKQTSEEELRNILAGRFPNAKTLKVEDVSGGCGAMYDIYVESNDFKQLSRVKQHQTIYDALKEQIKHIHGLHIVTKVPS